MREFCCFTRDGGREVPTLSIVLADSLERACLLAERDLLEEPDAVAVEIYEDDRLLYVLERGDGGAGSPRLP